MSGAASEQVHDAVLAAAFLIAEARNLKDCPDSTSYCCDRFKLGLEDFQLPRRAKGCLLKLMILVLAQIRSVWICTTRQQAQGPVGKFLTTRSADKACSS